MAKLTAAKVRTMRHGGRAKHEERHCDEHGLILRVQPTGGKSWVQRVTVGGKRIVVGLGGYPTVTLKEARETALANRRLARQGVDPRKARKTAPTFRAVAEAVIAVNAETWRGGMDGKSAGQWLASLNDYAYPVLGSMAVDAVTTADVLRVVKPIWNTKRETASRVRQRISAIMRYAMAQGHRADDPASDAILQALPKGRTATKHHRAIHYSKAGDAVRKVRDSKAWTATKLLFEFLVLTAARSGEARMAAWDEVDVEGATWTVPAERMKAGREHRVPLSPRCVALLREAQAVPRTKRTADSRLVFPSLTGKVISDATVGKLLREQGIDATAHGFRSTFRDWAAEQTDAPHSVMEAALAHAIPNAVEAAYARSDLFEKRRELMQRWAEFVGG